MSKKPESRLQRRIRARLEETFKGSWWFKVHGGPFQEDGIPDLVGCVEGLFFGLEVKRSGKGKTSDVQDAQISRINVAGGLACVVETPDEAIEVVLQTLEHHYGNEGRTRKVRLSRSGRAERTDLHVTREGRTDGADDPPMDRDASGRLRSRDGRARRGTDVTEKGNVARKTRRSRKVRSRS